MSYPPPPGPNDPSGQPPYGSEPPAQPPGQPPYQPPGGQPPGQPPYQPPGGQPPGGQPPGYGYPPQGGQPGYGGGPGQENSGSALGSLILGITSIVLCLGFVTGIPAIILGIKARKDIRESNGRIGGDGQALGGIITGILGTLIGTAIAAFVIFGIWLANETVDDIDNIYEETCQELADDSDPNNDCP